MLSSWIYEQSYWGLGTAKVFIGHAEAPYSRVGSIGRDTQDAEPPGPLGHTEAPYSQVGSIDIDNRDTEQPGPLGHAEAPYFRAGSFDRDTQDIEQLEYQYRPRIPGKEEIMRIYEDRIYMGMDKDRIYRPPDMIEKPGGLQIKGSGMRDRRRCLKWIRSSFSF